LRAGDEVNGIVGTGFVDEGDWYNGQIIEIYNIPEPATLPLIMCGLLMVAGTAIRGMRR